MPWLKGEDGSIDYSKMFPELVNAIENEKGIAVTKDGVDISQGVKNIDFSGNYVYVTVDENGILHLRFDAPNNKVPKFNESNEFSTAVVEIKSELHDCIIPSASTSMSMYGDWEAGSLKKCLNWNETSNACYLDLEASGPVFASSQETWFKVQVFDAYGNEAYSFESQAITEGLDENVRLEPKLYSPSVKAEIYIKDFKAESEGYSFVPKFKINMTKIMSDGGRFKVKITHYDTGSMYSYISDDILYNVSTLPVIGNYQVILDTSATLPEKDVAKYKWCSGIKYLANGQIVINLGPVVGLNSLAAFPGDKIFIESDAFNEEEVSIEPYDYTLAADNASTWKLTMPVKKDLAEAGNKTLKIYARNAFGTTQPLTINIPLNIDTKLDLDGSTDLVEKFYDETYRLTNNFGALWDSSKDLTSYDSGKGLLVIPHKGLMFPHSDWSHFIPDGSSNYSIAADLSTEKFWSRTFIGSLDDKFGGQFIIEGLTQEEIFDERLSLLLSYDNGTSWCSLKDVRNEEVSLSMNSVRVTGVMTDFIKEDDRKFIFEWSLPKTVSMPGTQKLYFQVCMKPTYPGCIESIALRGINGEEDW